MWLVIAQWPRPAMPHWPGRRRLAAVDAVFWPAFWILMLWHLRLEVPMGVTGPVLMAMLALSALSRFRRAVFDNADYRFTTWRWGKVLGGLLLVSGFIQLTRH